jgi:hypothetical protein
MVSMMLIISRATTPLCICKQNTDSFRWRSVEQPVPGDSRRCGGRELAINCTGGGYGRRYACSQQRAGKEIGTKEGFSGIAGVWPQVCL